MLINLALGKNKKDVDLDELERLASVHGKNIKAIAKLLKIGQSTLERRVVTFNSYKDAWQRGLARFNQNQGQH